MNTCPYIIRPRTVTAVVSPVFHVFLVVTALRRPTQREVQTQSPLCILLVTTFGSRVMNIGSVIYINIGLLSVIFICTFALEVIDFGG